MARRKLTAVDLIEEAKKRAVLFFICVVGLSYLMSLTSSSVWINMPAAAFLIFLLRYISYDLEMRSRLAGVQARSAPSSNTHVSMKKPVEYDVPSESTSWKLKVDSPIVESAIDQFTKHIVSEWVTNLWYSRLTRDRDVPEELEKIMNNVIGEIALRLRDVNLIDLLTRDIIVLLCEHLELYRLAQAKIGQNEMEKLTFDERDRQLKLVLSAERKLHFALFSPEAEHKVLQHLMSGLISITFKEKDLSCNFFRYTARELLACAVMRPILNLANPRFINERIEVFILNRANKSNKGIMPPAQDSSLTKTIVPPRSSADRFSQDQSGAGVELVQFNSSKSQTISVEGVPDAHNAKMNMYSVGSDGHLSNHGSHVLVDPHTQRYESAWGQKLDMMSRRKAEALAPEHFENMWSKGKNYPIKNVNSVSVHVSQKLNVNESVAREIKKVNCEHDMLNENLVNAASETISTVSQQEKRVKSDSSAGTGTGAFDVAISSAHSDGGGMEDEPIPCLDDIDFSSDNSPSTEADESDFVTGLDSPGIRVWDSKKNRGDSPSNIHHPLKSTEHHPKRSGKGRIHFHKPMKTLPLKKRTRSANSRLDTWHEGERTSFVVGDGRDILRASKGPGDSSDELDERTLDRASSGATASSSANFASRESYSTLIRSSENSSVMNPFFKLRCEVLGANVVKSGSKIFAVYSISVEDVDHNTWTIKRRFRHFEDLHRRLKEFSEYNLSLPPKHFLMPSLNIPIVQERCKSLDKYVKNLLQLPNVSKSIEVWDFLSVDSQTYLFSNSLSIVETFSVDLDHTPKVNTKNSPKNSNQVLNQTGWENVDELEESQVHMKPDRHYDGSKIKLDNNSGGGLQKGHSKLSATASSSFAKNPELGFNSSQPTAGNTSDPMTPTEWVPPNLSSPLLDLVDVIFQLHDGGWIRRQAFWIAKQLLQLGMGDAFDDWLLDKIQLLRKGSVIASGIKGIEQILWPDGIFISKHPKRQRPTPSESPSQSSLADRQTVSSKNEQVEKNKRKLNPIFTEEQLLEAARRAKFVHELMIDNAPSALFSLVGHNEYEHCVKDVYFFIQSTVCLKQLTFGLLELLLEAAFPELHDVIDFCHTEKEYFGGLDDE